MFVKLNWNILQPLSFLSAIVIIVVVILLIFEGSLKLPTSSEQVDVFYLNSSQASCCCQVVSWLPLSQLGLLPALDWMSIAPLLRSMRYAVEMLGTAAPPALKGTTASSFIHYCTASKNRIFIDHLHVPGTLKMQHPCPLAVQLWASYQSFISFSFLMHRLEIVITDCLLGLLHGFKKRSHTSNI